MDASAAQQGPIEGRRREILALLKALLSAIKSRSLYPTGHPTVLAALRELGASFDSVLGRNGVAVLGLIGRELVADGRPLPADQPFVAHFAGLLADWEVEKITLLRGARAEELEALVETLSLAPERLRERWRRAGRALHGGEAREIAAQLIQGLRGQRGPMLAALSLRQKSAYTFSHSLNVSLLMLAQVEMLPLTERQLEGVAAAGLLHDLGSFRSPGRSSRSRARRPTRSGRSCAGTPSSGSKFWKRCVMPETWR